MSEMEPRKRHSREVASRHIPQEVVPVSLDEAPGLVRDALRGTSLVNPVVGVVAGWGFFSPHLLFSAVDATHTRIELDLVGTVRGAESLLHPQRRAEIDRFFVAIQDELDRRERWRPRSSDTRSAIESAESFDNE